jgi:hypothetical protein
MSQEWKLVPVRPTEEMLIAGYATVHPDQLLVSAYQAMLAAAPVPPAGVEVEVLGYSVKGNRYAIRLTKAELLELYEGYTGDALVELVDRAHVTRLQADFKAKYQDHKRDLQKAWDERDALKAEVERVSTDRDYCKRVASHNKEVGEELQQRLTIADQRVDELEAELTKAKRGYEWESQRSAALLEELQEYEGSSGSLQPSLKENQGIPGTSFQRLNQLANEGE